MAKTNHTGSSVSTSARKPVLIVGALLLAVLGALFCRSFLPDLVHFNNDTPLGFIQPLADNGIADALGRWNDRNTLGTQMMTPLADVTNGLLWSLGAVGFAKFYAPLALLVVGLGAWFFLRQLGLRPLACGLGALAAALNSDFLATACWGVASQPIAFGLSFFALGLVVSRAPRAAWARVALAGLAVGLAVMEAVDIGAIFSVFVAGFIVYYTVVSGGASPSRGAVLGGVKVAVVALFAFWMAFGTVKDLVSTQIQGVAGMEGTAEARAARWDWATQWSLPKREVLGVAVPGLFGWRMDSSQHGISGGDYWGAAGRDPRWDRYFQAGQQGPPPGGFLRYGGGGLYAGVLVVLVAAWAGAQALRKQGSVFAPAQRRLLWFWLGVLLVSLLLAFGRHAPFYWFIYQLPGASFIRNPAKFMHVFEWALVVVFAYGVQGLSERYLAPAAADPAGPAEQLRRWWSQVKGFDRKWTLGSVAALALAVVGWIVYAASRNGLEAYLQTVQFEEGAAKAIAGFSIAQVGWFVLRLGLAVAVVTLVLSGCFAGRRARWGGLLAGLFLVVDLAVANQPWIIYWNYPQKYATNPIIEQLRKQPYEHRVAILPSWMPSAFQASPELARTEQTLEQLYRIEWAQHHFQYYGVQSLDIVQMPRMPADLEAFETALQFRGTPETMHLLKRRWQLTNTRYLLGAFPFIEVLNRVFDPGTFRFKQLERFDIVPKPGLAQARTLEEVTAAPSTNGSCALIEFTGALPRAQLYTDWQVSTNDQAALEQLASKSFDPAKTVLVASPGATVPGLESNLESKGSSPEAQSPANAGTVEFTGYRPVKIDLRAKAEADSVLLLNDRFDPGWKVFVDGKPQTLLRCNYIMRGVVVPKGEHQVEFRFAPPVPGLYVSLAAMAAALLLLGYVGLAKGPQAKPEKKTAAEREKARANG